MEQKPNNNGKKKKPTDKKAVPNVSKDKIRELLKEVMMQDIEEYEKRQDIDIEAMICTIEEFMKCFVLFGYNLNSEPVLVTNAKNQLEADALQTAFSKLFSTMNGSDGNGKL